MLDGCCGKRRTKKGREFKFINGTLFNVDGADGEPAHLPCNINEVMPSVLGSARRAVSSSLSVVPWLLLTVQTMSSTKGLDVGLRKGCQ